MGDVWQTLTYYYQFGQGGALLYFIIPFGLYVVVRVSVAIVASFVLPHSSVQVRQSNVIGRELISSVVVLGSVAALFVLTAHGVDTVLRHGAANPSSVARNSYALMEADKALFGTYVPFWFHDGTNILKWLFDGISPILLIIYWSMTKILGASLFLMFVINELVFLRMFLAVFVCLFVSLPVWYAVPALSPLEAYHKPVIEGVPFNESIRQTLRSYAPPRALTGYFSYVQSIAPKNVGREEKFLAITTFPSMHVAWVTVLVFFAGVIAFPTLSIGIPYMLINALAAVYSLQHYAIDAVAGLFIAVLAIGAVYILPIEAIARADLFSHVANDRNRVIALVKKIIQPRALTIR